MAWKVVKFRRELGFQNIMMEGDMPEIVYALQKEGCCWSMYGQLIDDARILMNGFQSWFVCYIKRNANKGAHRLANEAISRSLDQVDGRFPVFYW